MHQTALNMSAAELSLHKTFTSMTESEGKAAGTDELISFIDFCLITAKNAVISLLLHLFLLPSTSLFLPILLPRISPSSFCLLFLLPLQSQVDVQAGRLFSNQVRIAGIDWWMVCP